LAGYRYFYAMIAGNTEGIAYRTLMYSRKVTIAHWLAFWLPVLCLAVLIAITIVRKRRERIVLLDEF
jgi:hypothetical protein